MSRLRIIGRRLVARTLLAGVALHLGLQAAWAQTPETVQLGPSKSYVYPYLLVGFCIALGLMVLCRPRNRSTEIEKETSLTS